MTLLENPEYIEALMHEVTNLKIHAEPQEIANLDMKTFQPEKSHRCIYGLMTGNCYSARAAKLIKLSCDRVMKAKGFSDLHLCTELNGSVKGRRFNPNSRQGPKIESFWSPIEVYIVYNKNVRDKPEKNKELIQFLKSEIDTFTP